VTCSSNALSTANRVTNMIRSSHIVLAAVLIFPSATVIAADAPPPPQDPLYAIAAEGGETTTEISKLAGVSPFFHVYRDNGEPLEIVPNPYLDMERGTGPAAAQMLVDRGIAVLVGAQVPGPKMMDVLDSNHVRFVRRIGTVGDVASELKE
jgi:predicted Fe-Mo cluster-binding NifX family protein